MSTKDSTAIQYNAAARVEWDQTQTHELPASASLRENALMSFQQRDIGPSQESTEASTILYIFPLGLSEEQLIESERKHYKQ